MRVVTSRTSALSPARWLAGALALLLAVTPVAGQTSGNSSTQSTGPVATNPKPAKKTAKPAARSKKAGKRVGKAARAARTARIKQAFIASTELRPMAQQLATLRTPAAYAGVTKYAHQHTGEAAATAYLALGHAYLLDKRYGEAEANFRLARQSGEEL